MNDDQLRMLLQRSVGGLRADPAMADRAWRTAVQQDRRQRFAIVAGAAAAVAMVTVLIANPPSFDRTAPPASVPSSASASSTDTPATPSVPPPGKTPESFPDQLRRIQQPPWDDVDPDELPILKTKLPVTLDPRNSSAAPLSSDPVETALAVVQLSGEVLDIRVLGDDRRWRKLDTPGLEPSFSDGSVVSLIGGSPISPDGRRLALSQPDEVVVIDLTSGSSQQFDLPANDVPPWVGRATQWSPDGTQIITGPATYSRTLRPMEGWLVDVSSGDVQRVPYDPWQAAFASDGTVVELRNWDCGLCQVWHYQDDRLTERVTLDVELYVVAPAVGDVTAVSRAVRGWSGSKGIEDQDGILVVDPESGEMLAELPMRKPHLAESAKLFGWLDAETLIFSVFSFAEQESPVLQRTLVAWNYKSGQLNRLTHPAGMSSGLTLALAVQQLR